MQGEFGNAEIQTPRDRNGTFEPQPIDKHQRRFPGIDQKVIALYAKAIYTTKTIESVNSVIRKVIRNRKIFPSEQSATRIIYLAIAEAAKKWSKPIVHWNRALQQFAIKFDDRLPTHLLNQQNEPLHKNNDRLYFRS